MKRPEPVNEILKLFELKPGEWTEEDSIKEELWNNSVAKAKVYEWNLKSIYEGKYNPISALKAYTNQREKYFSQWK